MSTTSKFSSLTTCKKINNNVKRIWRAWVLLGTNNTFSLNYAKYMRNRTYFSWLAILKLGGTQVRTRFRRHIFCRQFLNSFSHPSWRIVWIWPIYKTNGLYPAILWYFRYPKQERTKFFNQDFFCNRDFKIPHFSLLFLLYSDITA